MDNKKYYERLSRIMFREQLCSLHAAACWLSAGNYFFIGTRKKPVSRAMIAAREK